MKILIAKKESVNGIIQYGISDIYMLDESTGSKMKLDRATSIDISYSATSGGQSSVKLVFNNVDVVTVDESELEDELIEE